MSNILNNLRHV